MPESLCPTVRYFCVSGLPGQSNKVPIIGGYLYKSVPVVSLQYRIITLDIIKLDNGEGRIFPEEPD